mmetsp:Transcript_41631/g.109897  ORF Transcript_41631/g.109897 Transcript_41631/m.109897 type:complete len:201 (-) Transcript_41631:67-669(-)
MQFQTKTKIVTLRFQTRTRHGTGCGLFGSGAHWQKSRCTREPCAEGLLHVELNTTIRRTIWTHLMMGTSHWSSVLSKKFTIIQTRMQNIAGVRSETMRMKQQIQHRKCCMKTSSWCCLTTIASACAAGKPCSMSSSREICGCPACMPDRRLLTDEIRTGAARPFGGGSWLPASPAVSPLSRTSGLPRTSGGAWAWAIASG